MSQNSETSMPTSTSSPTGQGSPSSEAPSPSNYDKLSGETSHDSEIAFEGLGAEIDDSIGTLGETGVSAKPTLQPTAPAVQTQQPVAQPVVPTQPQAPPQVQPAQQPQAQPGTQPQPQAQAPEVSSQPQSLDSVLQSFATHGPDIANALAQEFSIDPAMTQELEENYAQAVPKLLASTFVKAVSTSLQYMQQFVPQLVQQMQTQQSMYKEAEDAFFKQFSNLDRVTHGRDITLYARAFASQNPGMSRDELFSMVGNAVRAKYGLFGNPAPAQVPRAPVQPFMPAQGGVPGAQLSHTADASPFWGLGTDHETT